MAESLEGRLFLVTGANTGIGRATAQELAKRGAEVVLACRTKSKADPVVDEIRAATGNDNVSFHKLDLADLASVRDSAAAFLDSGRKLDVLIDNAGLAGHQGLTKDGFELGFGTNHLGHFLFTLLLLDKLRESSPSRIVVVASQSHYSAKGINFGVVRQKTKTTTGLREYAVSKLANVLFSAELARRMEGTGVNTYSLNPGQIASDIWRRIPWPVRPLMMRFMKTVEEGAQTTLYCATSDEVASDSGKYYDSCQEKTPSRYARDHDLASDLWARSCEMVGIDDPLPQ